MSSPDLFNDNPAIDAMLRLLLAGTPDPALDPLPGATAARDALRHAYIDVMREMTAEALEARPAGASVWRVTSDPVAEFKELCDRIERRARWRREEGLAEVSAPSAGRVRLAEEFHRRPAAIWTETERRLLDAVVERAFERGVGTDRQRELLHGYLDDNLALTGAQFDEIARMLVRSMKT